VIRHSIEYDDNDRVVIGRLIGAIEILIFHKISFSNFATAKAEELAFTELFQLTREHESFQQIYSQRA